MSDTKTKINLEKEVLELASKIEKDLVIDKKTGLVTENKSLYEENVPEGLTVEVIEKVADYNTKFIAAGAFAFGNIAINAMASNKSLDNATATFKMIDKDSVSYNLERHKVFNNHLGNGEAIDKYGVITTSYDVRGGKNAGQLKTARKLIAEIASSKLK